MNTYFVLIVTIDFHIPMALSLKDKRRHVKSLKQKLQNRFNASVAEIAFHDDWQHALIGLSLIGADRSYLQSQLPQIEKQVLEQGDIEVIAINHEWL